jgi:hypothetical protein
MERVNQNCQNSNLEIEVKAVKRPRFKAGAELSGKVNKIHIDVNQHEMEDAEAIELKLVFFNEVCEKTKPGNCK